MPEAWLSFAVVNFVQLFLFIARATYEKKLSDIPRLLLWGVLTGIPLGLLFDLTLGKSFGFYSYTLGFSTLFLVLNAVISNGLFAANILLLRQVRLLQFYIWIIVLVIGYETTNLFFYMWTWEVTLQPIELLIFLLAGYLGTATLVAVIWHVFLGYRFVFVDKLLKK
jgi:hypothetical protein